MPPNENNSSVNNETDENLEEFHCTCCDTTQNINDTEEYTTRNDEAICEQCYDNDHYTCESCGEIEHLEHSCRAPNDEYYCEDCAGSSFSYCYECSEPTWHDEQYESSIDGEYRCEHCHHEHGYDSDGFFEDSPVSVQVNHHNSVDYNKLDIKRLVGIEAECVFGDCESDEDGTPMALGDVPTGWHEAYDGSIEGNGREMISSPANGNILWTRIKQLENWATKHNVYVNRSCGMHVHFDATDTRWEDLRAIALVALKVEQHLFDMLPPSRQNSNWCKRISMSIKSLINCTTSAEFVELWYEDSGISREKYNDSRYHGLNLHARFYLGTIEFRYHSGTLNSEKIINWVKICNSIVETGMKLSRDANWVEGQRFYTEIQDVERVDVVNTITKDQKLSSLADTLKHMVDIDVSMVEYMMKRMAKFNNISTWDERYDMVESYLDNQTCSI